MTVRGQERTSIFGVGEYGRPNSLEWTDGIPSQQRNFPYSGIDVQNARMDRWKDRTKLALLPYFRDEAFLASHVVLEKEVHVLQFIKITLLSKHIYII